MGGCDSELEHLRERVSCAVLLENLSPPWKLDRRESTRDSLKYRRGRGEIIIVNHGGHGWWDAGGTAKGDVFALVQHLRPGLNFGHVRRLLREYVGLRPSFPLFHAAREKGLSGAPAVERWRKARPLRPGSKAWRYLSEKRALPDQILHVAAAWEAVREGGYGSAWFAHRDHAGQVTGFEMRGVSFRGFGKGGGKSLFRLPGWPRRTSGAPRRIVVAEAPIDALSLATLEGPAEDTLYVATGGGMGPLSIEALTLLLANAAAVRGGGMVAATDNDSTGRRYADLLADLARTAGVAFQRLHPRDDIKDWNDVLRQGRA